MTEEQMTALITFLEHDLELDFTFYDEESRQTKEDQLELYLNSAIKFITTEGIELDYSKYQDQMLIVMYAGWLYEKRKDVTAQMPRMLRYNLNNRLFFQEGEEV